MTYAPNARGLAALVANATEGPWERRGKQTIGSPLRGHTICKTDWHNGGSDAALIVKTPDLAALLLEARALFLAPDPGSIETQRRIAAFLEATE